ncbi:MAG: excinuclease ABC subunit UvrA [Polyangiaceae bacterium]|nr:excinuclease ABC subunit UvrA [Polyangiaceae bacterium]
MNLLVVRGARQHNLKDVGCAIPRDRLVVITGPSGSGKSSLAFDTIYAEGQRRYVESLSAYARQFLEQLAKPAVESIEGLSPAIAIEQRALAKSPRSTVGTVTEIADYLRLLFARVGTPHCPSCGKIIQAQTVQQIVDSILGMEDGARVTLLAPIVRSRKGELKLELERLRREGFVRVRIDGELVDLGDEIVLDGKKSHDLDVVVDRLVLKDGLKGRVTDSVELGLKLGEGRVLVDPGDGTDPFFLSERFACVDCGVSLPPIEPRMFSFNGPHGACPRCDGIGTRTRVDPERVVPDGKRTLREGAVVAWGRRGSVELALEVDRAVKVLGVDPDTAWKKLPDATRQLILFGPPEASAEAAQPTKKRRGRATEGYEGIVPRLEHALESGEMTREIDDDDLVDGAPREEELGRFVVTRICDVCGGKRLRPESLAVRLGGKNIADLGRMPLSELSRHLDKLTGPESSDELSARARAIAEPLLKAVIARLGFLIDVGLDYLSLERSAATLSGGEGQRIRLATQIGAALVGVLYVLDEPSVGLHARDNARLLEALRRLVDLGNTVLVVEHDRDTILAADYLIDMGPGAGVHGGTIVSQGEPETVIGDPKSITGPYLSGKKSVFVPQKRKAPDGRSIVIKNATEHNLKGVDLEIPVGLLTSVTGVSGSGKSSLIIDTLLPAARQRMYRAADQVGACDAVVGLEHFDKVVSIDQAPIGRTPRSNPATYTGTFALLRELFSSLPEARARGYKPGRFSFNVKGGRCEACQGDGVLRVEMHFLPDVFVECETCNGKRYNRETLEVKYRGHSIADILDLTVDEALAELEAIPRIREQLSALSRVGLGYIKLGQPATTLSGGEAQRVKLARELARRATGSTLYILDEPTTGLHFSDVELLLVALLGLRDAGNTVVIIEHNLELVASSDWVVDLGPEGGERGGEIIAHGTPEVVAKVDASHTGRFLRPVLDVAPQAASGPGRSKRAAKGGAAARAK